MKKLMVVALAVGLVGVLVADGATKKVRTPEEEAAWQAERARRFYIRNGGFVVQPQAERRCVAFVNVGNAVDRAILDGVAAGVRSMFQFPVVVTSEKPSDAGVVIELKEGDDPATLLLAPESGYASVNVRSLRADNPDAEKLKVRVGKESWRAFMYVLGGGNDTQPNCLMKPVASLAALDKLCPAAPCPMTANEVSAGAAVFGIRPERTVTYRQACKEGWASAPTNDVQKAIWNEVHAMPTEPLKIKPETKKVSD